MHSVYVSSQLLVSVFLLQSLKILILPCTCYLLQVCNSLCHAKVCEIQVRNNKAAGFRKVTCLDALKPLLPMQMTRFQYCNIAIIPFQATVLGKVICLDGGQPL